MPQPARSHSRALLLAAAAAVLPGLGHVLLGRRRIGGPVLAGVGSLAAVVIGLLLAADRAALAAAAVSESVLVAATIACVALALGWVGLIAHTYFLARPRALPPVPRAGGAVLVVALCAAVAVPLGTAATFADSQRRLLDEVFAGGPVATREAPLPPRLNLLLLGSDAAPDRHGVRTDTIIVASIDTQTAETTLFALPRNIQRAPFPFGSAAEQRFPDGFRDPASGAVLLNSVLDYGAAHPDLAPEGPTGEPGADLLMSTITRMLGLPLHHHVLVDMAALEAIVDALGGVVVDVGPEPLPIGGVTPSGRLVEPDGYLQPGVQHLDGYEALWFARSRRNSDDYARMERQRDLIAATLTQQEPAELLHNFRAVAAAASDGVRTDMPRTLLPRLVALLDRTGPPQLQAVSFDPDLVDPADPEETFRPARPDPGLMRRVVREALADDRRSGSSRSALAGSGGVPPG